MDRESRTGTGSNDKTPIAGLNGVKKEGNLHILNGSGRGILFFQPVNHGEEHIDEDRRILIGRWTLLTWKMAR